MELKSSNSGVKLQVTLGVILVALVVLPEVAKCDLKGLLLSTVSKNKDSKIENRKFQLDHQKLSQELSSAHSQAINGDTPLSSEPESKLEKESKGFFKIIGDIVKKAIEPKQYFELIFRYHKWFSNYRALQKVTDYTVPDALEVLRVEYAREEAAVIAEDEEKEHQRQLKEHPLVEEEKKDTEEAEEVLLKEDKPEESEEHIEDNQQQEVTAKPEVRVQSIEFIFRVLKRLIVRLEANLKKLEDKEGVEVDVEICPKLLELDEEAVRRSMEGVKKSVLKSAVNVFTGEAIGVARIATFNGLAMYMESKADVGDALDQLRPIILLLGTATTPLFFSYLSSLKMRAAFSLMNRVTS